jgi:hypothetical protein
MHARQVVRAGYTLKRTQKPAHVQCTSTSQRQAPRREGGGETHCRKPWCRTSTQRSCKRNRSRPLLACSLPQNNPRRAIAAHGVPPNRPLPRISPVIFYLRPGRAQMAPGRCTTVRSHGRRLASQGDCGGRTVRHDESRSPSDPATNAAPPVCVYAAGAAIAPELPHGSPRPEALLAGSRGPARPRPAWPGPQKHAARTARAPPLPQPPVRTPRLRCRSPTYPLPALPPPARLRLTLFQNGLVQGSTKHLNSEVHISAEDGEQYGGGSTAVHA